MKAVLTALLLGCLALVSQKAAAQCSDEVCVRTATQLTSVTTQQSAVLDATLNGLLGSGTAVDLTTADDTALATSSIKLSDLTTALNAAGVGTDATSALNTTASLKTVLQAAATAAQAEGNVSTANALTKLANQTASVNTSGIKLADLISADSRSGPLASSTLNALDLVTGTASLFNSKNVASVNQVTVSGAALGLGSSITNVQLALVVIEPAVFVCGPVGTQFFSANVRVRARVNLTGSGLAITVPGLTSANLNLVSLDLVAAVGRASGTIQAINALLGTVTVQATPGLAELYLGTISDANFLDRTTAIDPNTELTPAVIGSLSLKLAIVTASASVSAKGYAKGANPTASTLNFAGPYAQTLTATTSASSASDLVNTLLSNLTVTVGPISPALPLPPPLTLDALLNNLLTTVTSALKSTSGILKPILDAATTGAIDPLLSQLGIKLGQVSVTVEKPYQVSAGSTCNDLNFCTDGDICSAAGVCAGTAKTCSDGLDCTNDSCNPATGTCTSAVSAAFCLINGACVAGGTSDPSNSCMACTPTTLQTGYSLKPSGATCDDGAYCTTGDTCSALGVCVATPRDCSDGLICTLDVCDETLDRCNSAISIGCVVAGACVLPGSDDPSNQCRSCNPLLSSTSFSNKAAGAICADGRFCTTGDACDGQGLCASTPRNCEDGLGCTSNTCDEASGSCTSSISGGCLINGACVGAGTPDPLSSCRSCNPAVSTLSYSNNGANTPCSDGLFCTTGDTCNALGLCIGTPRVCDPSGVGCSSTCDEVSGTCKTGTLGCLIDGSCIAPGTDDPSNHCRACVPTTSTTAWTNKANGTSCNDGQFCTSVDTCNGSGTCTGTARDCNDNLSCTTDTCDETNDRCNAAVSGSCIISGACVAGGTVDPSNPCQSCNPSISSTGWTSVAAGTTCSDGQFCTINDACNGEGRCLGAARDCNAGAGTCASVCDELGDRCRNDLVSCLIDGLCVAAGAIDPNNPCRECQPAILPTAFVNRLLGVTCDDGLFCTTGDTCNAQGVCTGVARGCGTDASGTCGTSCNEALDTCSTGVSGCNIDGVCRAAGDVDPTNSCHVCNPTLSISTWSPKGPGTSCSDGLFCTSNDTCDLAGTCTGTATACSDGLTCTTDSCDESTRHCTSTVSSGCLINGGCFAAGDPDPNNPCRTCNPTVSATSWTASAVNAACDDGKFCTIGDSCNTQGVCTGPSRSCSSDCSSFCDEPSDSCRSDVSGCAIGELCVSDGTDDPSNPCRTCDADLSTSDWSLKPAGTLCSDGFFCTANDSCSAVGLCAGTQQDCSDGQSCTVDSCDETAGVCKHASGSSCLINGQCIAAGTLDPTSACRVCDPSSNPSGWTNSPINVSCNDGKFCTPADVCDGAGTCVGSGSACQGDASGCTSQMCDETTDTCRDVVSSGCRINSVCVAEGAVSDSDRCMVCVSAQSTSSYTFVSTSVGCTSRSDGGMNQNNPITTVNDDGGLSDGSVRHDSGTIVGPIDVDDDAGNRTGGLAGGASCSLATGPSEARNAGWLLLALAGLLYRRRRQA